jgi:HAD superfamily hydrolase (TIGR01509 family)
VLQALIWDVDGTIAETERDGHRLAFNAAFEACGLSWHWNVATYGRLLQITGGRERLLHDMATRSDAPRSSADRATLAADLHARKNSIYARMVALGRIEPRPGVLRLMAEARAAGLRQAIATTTSRSNVEALLGQLIGPDWQTLFAAVVCGEDVLRKKPDPEAYRLALVRLGVSAVEALAFEDAEPGLRAAVGARLPVLLTPSVYFPATVEPRALLLCPDLDQVALADLQALHRRHLEG